MDTGYKGLEGQVGQVSLFLKRMRGILLHFTSLWGPYGAGDLGPAARQMAALMAQGGWTLWQMLPLNYPNPAMGYSPYASYGAFPLSPMVISVDDLAEQGLIDHDIKSSLVVKLTDPWRADLDGAFTSRRRAVEEVFRRFKKGNLPDVRGIAEDYQHFLDEMEFWVYPWGLFMALKESFNGVHWTKWPDWARNARSASAAIGSGLAERADFFRFEQFLAFRQLRSFKDACASHGIMLVGDLPIYVAHDGMDPWTFPELFELDLNGDPLEVAGVPPDYFSDTGQRWGNPLYRWDVMEQDRYNWWFVRIKASLEVFHAVRIDHFRGFEGYWSMPRDEETAVRGRWREGPGARFFDVLLERFGLGLPSEGEACPLPLVAEDLGVITDSVTALRRRYRMPGMRVLQFAFSGDQGNPHLPWNHEVLGVAYTGTHDNDTTMGWWLKASRSERMALRAVMGRPLDPEDAVEAMVRLTLLSPSCWRIVPIQDLLFLGSQHRMNTPSSVLGNWAFRVHMLDFGGLRDGRYDWL